MKRTIIALIAAALLMLPAISVAQRQGGGEGQQHLKSSTMKGSMGMMRANMGLMAEITGKMQQMLSTGRMNPERQKHVLNMMKQMSHMMKEMAVPHGEEVKKRHNLELQEMRNELDSL
jgi:hypothetical protein